MLSIGVIRTAGDAATCTGGRPAQATRTRTSWPVMPSTSPQHPQEWGVTVNIDVVGSSVDF